ncbi:BadF/BadG/BcrA/BcrD ATPase family protein, partial [Catenulispora rubra]|uniref:BadF/BadG/BcrA/BcrD ATPase family protein n=1 Tax=Catenulispora rubra TaxID=280293 RepID=UPI001E3D3632
MSDVTVAFAAGTPAPDGTLLVSGTGAVAARMHDRLPVHFRDGYGWLLGDEGSGFWIGRQAARAALAAADGRRPMAELATSVLARLIDVDQDPATGYPRVGTPAPSAIPATTPTANSTPAATSTTTSSALAATNKLAAHATPAAP